MILALAIVDEN